MQDVDKATSSAYDPLYWQHLLGIYGAPHHQSPAAAIQQSAPHAHSNPPGDSPAPQGISDHEGAPKACVCLERLYMPCGFHVRAKVTADSSQVFRQGVEGVCSTCLCTLPISHGAVSFMNRTLLREVHARQEFTKLKY